ncbi:hypothetical protein EJ05DRAFT_350144 [Pseudovirgaria hyperparasitica]|uniref:IMS import disulfide relay-system CHCH-CHCH-like Cx9C domain-containing protein n=1 Tax=Pseudovirgaria hyperparasitica TaxID=470096 RepID=A0A6A6W8N7_9PEZI|nr:uncharacterized protein EJ05DRAFT_350144 [Pseudovirgaria hyperparasitica]KAF2758394.1 hypothetical protein EJ05DRAFT_350144 [Pseudovirgaria hyperparasitica]
MPGRTRPVDRLASASVKCAKEGAAYGKCITADYKNIHKDKCLTEFLKLKQCYTAALKR